MQDTYGANTLQPNAELTATIASIAQEVMACVPALEVGQPLQLAAYYREDLFAGDDAEPSHIVVAFSRLLNGITMPPTFPLGENGESLLRKGYAYKLNVTHSSKSSVSNASCAGTWAT